MNAITTYHHNTLGDIRTTVTEHGDPMFCLKDVCEVLELNQVSRVKSRLDQRGVTLSKVGVQTGLNTDGTPIYQQVPMNFINEPNLYRCIFRSRKPEAAAFQAWVFDEVLPSIRKQGGYMATRQDETPEETMARAMVIAQATIARREERIRQLENEGEAKQKIIELQAESLKEAAPKVDYYNNVLQSVDYQTTEQVAKSIGMTAMALNKHLKSAGIIYRQSNQWLVKAPYCRWNLHGTRTHSYYHSDGRTGTVRYTVWNERGAMFIRALNATDWVVKDAIKHINGNG